MAPRLPPDEIDRLLSEVQELRSLRRGLVAELDQALKLLQEVRTRVSGPRH